MKPEKYSLGLIGYPLEHSLSPRLHYAALAAMNVQGEYRLYTVPPFPGGAVALEYLIRDLRQDNIHGLNVTIPHKQNVIRFLDKFNPAASMIGAVNTIYLQAGYLQGENTDAPGFLADLAQVVDKNSVSGQRREAIVLGAGGSARAVVYALLEDGWQVIVAARRLTQAKELINRYRSTDLSDRLSATKLGKDELEKVASRIDLVVNTTPVGMWPHIDESPWPREMPLPSGAVVYDLIYNPPNTALLQAAQTDGLVVRNGLGMLIEQAALALERWTDVPVPRQPMWEAVPEFVNE